MLLFAAVSSIQSRLTLNGWQAAWTAGTWSAF